MQTVFRVEQVLRGDSALVAIEGVDARINMLPDERVVIG